MKKLLFVAILLIPSAFSFAQKVVEDKNAQRRQVSGFHGVKVSHGIDLFISQGNEESVAVSASEEEYRNKIKTVVENGILKIYYDDAKSWGINWGSRKLRAYVSY
jgi:hypothetical protein